MSEATTTAAEAPKSVLPYDPEPDHVVAARSVLKEANRILNEKLAALGHFASVFGRESPEYAKALEQVHAAQAVANMAAIDKDIVVSKHGLSLHEKRHEEACVALRAAMKAGDEEMVNAHIKARDAAHKALHGPDGHPEEGLIVRHDTRMKRYADPSAHAHVSEATKQALSAHGLSR